MATTTKSAIGDLLHRINEGATNSQTPLSEVMRLCLRLGRLLNNEELSNWAKNEAGRYQSADSLPDYRIFKTQARGTFLGPFGGHTNVPIPEFLVEEEHRDMLCKVYLTQSVGELEQLTHGSKDTNTITIPWPGDLIWYYQQKGISQLAAAEQILTTTMIAGTLEVIRTRVIEFVLTIEKELSIDIMAYDNNKKPLGASAQEKAGQIFNMTINGGSNFAFGNSGTTNQQAIQDQPGDLKGLKEKLAQFGVPDVLINDLDTALAKDADSEQQPGPYVNGWFGRLATKVGTGAVQLIGSVTTMTVMAEVKRFLGLPPG